MKRILTISISAVLMVTCACVKKDFDQPSTANVDPNIKANVTIGDVIAMSKGTVPALITQDVIVSGIVVADDASGNFYKEMIVQDDSRGISVQIDQSNFHTSYPIGRRVFIKCKGLYIASDADGNYQLG